MQSAAVEKQLQGLKREQEQVQKLTAIVMLLLWVWW